MRVKAVRLPTGKDPADVVTADAKEFTSMVQNAQSIVEFFLSVLSAAERDEVRLLRAVEGVVLPLVVAVKSPLEQNRFIEIIARAISSTPEAVHAALPRLEVEPGEKEEALAQERAPRSGAPYVAITPFSHRHTLLLAAIATYPNTPFAEKLQTEYNRIIGAPASLEGLDERALFEAGLAFDETPPENAASELLREFEKAFLAEQFQAATLALRRAEATGNTEDIHSALSTCSSISQKISQLH
jgi:DNA primase